MATNLSPRRSLSRYSLLLVPLLTLVGILSGCGASSTVVSSHPTGSTPTSTPTQELKGTINEFPLPTPNFYPDRLLAGPDGNLWFTEAVSNGCQSGKIGRITPAGKVSEFPLSSASKAGGITTGPDSNLWFTESACAKGQSGKIGRITRRVRSASSLCHPTAILVKSPRGRIMPSGSPNLATTTGMTRSDASPPQARSANSCCPLLTSTLAASWLGRTVTSGLSNLATTTTTSTI